MPGLLKNSSRNETVNERVERIRRLQEEVMLEKRDRQRKNTKLIKEEQKINVGDVVVMKNQLCKDKLAPKWIGPYVVEHVQGNCSYIVSDCEKKKNFVVHRKNLKRVISDEAADKMKCKHLKTLGDDRKVCGGGIAAVEYNLSDEDHERVKRIKENCFCFRKYFDI